MNTTAVVLLRFIMKIYNGISTIFFNVYVYRIRTKLCFSNIIQANSFLKMFYFKMYAAVVVTLYSAKNIRRKLPSSKHNNNRYLDSLVLYYLVGYLGDVTISKGKARKGKTKLRIIRICSVYCWLYPTPSFLYMHLDVQFKLVMIRINPYLYGWRRPFAFCILIVICNNNKRRLRLQILND